MQRTIDIIQTYCGIEISEKFVMVICKLQQLFKNCIIFTSCKQFLKKLIIAYATDFDIHKSPSRI